MLKYNQVLANASNEDKVGLLEKLLDTKQVLSDIHGLEVREEPIELTNSSKILASYSVDGELGFFLKQSLESETILLVILVYNEALFPIVKEIFDDRFSFVEMEKIIQQAKSEGYTSEETLSLIGEIASNSGNPDPGILKAFEAFINSASSSVRRQVPHEIFRNRIYWESLFPKLEGRLAVEPDGNVKYEIEDVIEMIEEEWEREKIVAARKREFE